MNEVIDTELQNMFIEKEVNENENEILEMADKLVKIRKEREIAETKTKDLKAEEEILIDNLSMYMISKGLKSIDRDDGIKLTSVITPAFYIKADKKQDFLQALKEHGDGGLIKEDVPYQTMNAFFKGLESQMKDRDISDDIKQTTANTLQMYAPLVEKIDRRGIQIRGLKNKVNKE